MKNVTLQFVVNVEIECTEPDSFTDQKEFIKKDAIAMKPYLRDKIISALSGAWQFSSAVDTITMKPPKFI